METEQDPLTKIKKWNRSLSTSKYHMTLGGRGQRVVATVVVVYVWEGVQIICLQDTANNTHCVTLGLRDACQTNPNNEPLGEMEADAPEQSTDEACAISVWLL